MYLTRADVTAQERACPYAALPGSLTPPVTACHTAPMRFFNTEGPVHPDKHYCVPPLARLDLDRILTFIRREKYFVLHAPRQTGKTSALLALRDLLNAGSADGYRCVYANIEVGQWAREDVEAAMRSILGGLASRARRTLGDDALEEMWPGLLAKYGPGAALGETLSRWAEADPRPLVLLLDEIDTLVGDTLIAVLRQLRAGYDLRPESFPQSVILCGVRDVRDYRIHTNSQKDIVTGGSAFNIKAESLRMGDFSEDEMRALLAQHTGETGQTFAPDALECLWTRTRGQPWLVNALAYEVCFRNEAGHDGARAITAGKILEAQEQLVMRRVTHLDQLADKLREARVRRVVEPLLSGGDERPFSAHDLEYVRDLGLIARDAPTRIANPVYAEVVPRELTYTTEAGLVQETTWYVDADGSLDVVKLLEAFQTFFREHSEHWVERFEYREAGPQLLLQAFLHRIVNGGGRIEREYGLGRGRTDLLIAWPATTPGRTVNKVVVECKVMHPRKGLESTIEAGLVQTAAYMDRCGAAEGHLVVFDRDADRSWEEKVFRRAPDRDVRIHVWGM